MTYQQARQFLDRFPRFEVKPGLSRIQNLAERLGDPHLRYPTIHVAGTNGKGSVVATLDAILRDAGYRVGRFTSPQLVSFRDRIAVDGEWISKADVTAGVQRLVPVVEMLDELPSQFEIITALAFDHLARSNIDIAVIEVGLGGRFDATNIIQPQLAILTNVSLDHQALLGDTVEAIAWEKAGIAKTGRPLLRGRLTPEASRVVDTECEAVGAVPLYPSATLSRIARDWDTATYETSWHGKPLRLRSSLIGSGQASNLELVLEAVDVLNGQGLSIRAESIVRGIASVEWPGRLEVHGTGPRIVLDGAHNVAAARLLAADVADLVPNWRHRHLLYASFGDKDTATILSELRTAFSAVSVCPMSNPRALPVDVLADLAAQRFDNVIRYDSVAAGISAWRARANPDDTLVIAGSLSLIGEVKRSLEEGCASNG